MHLGLSHELSLFLLKRDTNWREPFASLLLLSLFDRNNDYSLDRRSRMENEQFHTVVHVRQDSDYHINCHCLCWSRIVIEESMVTLFCYHPSWTQRMAVSVIVRVPCIMNNCVESFIFHATLPITWTFIVCANVDRYWRESVDCLVLISPFNSNNKS